VFAAGCGRVFTGTFEQLAHSLLRIAQLPPDTLLYCAHEYTLDNIGFAKWVEPDNPALLEREVDVLAKAEKGIPTVPSTLAIELATNPFLRLSQPAVVAAARRHMAQPSSDPIAVFTALRQWKDREYD
jgi:hydroxyacylglutathione hydrolase